MFPLGTVLLPGVGLPLHVFEPRYQALMRDILGGDRAFGVALIERGSEVGGGEERMGFGTVATVVEAEPLPGGRWAVITVGGARFRVLRWLPDDPYPRAEVELLADHPLPAEAAPALLAVERTVRRCLAMRTELGEAVPPAAVELAPDPTVALWQLAALAGLTPLDQVALLSTEDPLDRLAMLTRLAGEAAEVLTFRLGGGAG